MILMILMILMLGSTIFDVVILVCFINVSIIMCIRVKAKGDIFRILLFKLNNIIQGASIIGQTRMSFFFPLLILIIFFLPLTYFDLLLT